MKLNFRSSGKSLSFNCSNKNVKFSNILGWFALHHVSRTVGQGEMVHGCQKVMACVWQLCTLYMLRSKLHLVVKGSLIPYIIIYREGFDRQADKWQKAYYITTRRTWKHLLTKQILITYNCCNISKINLYIVYGGFTLMGRPRGGRKLLKFTN